MSDKKLDCIGWSDVLLWIACAESIHCGEKGSLWGNLRLRAMRSDRLVLMTHRTANMHKSKLKKQFKLSDCK
jgi:hypothetical protein